MSRFNYIPALLLFLTIFGCWPDAVSTRQAREPEYLLSQTQSQVGMGTLTGKVTRGPLSPVERPGSRGAEPVTGFRVIISTLDGRQAASAVTDDQGEYRVNLPPGSYRISTGMLPRGSFSRDLPATVTVIEGQEKRLDIRLDTGIR